MHHEMEKHSAPIVLKCIDFRTSTTTEEWLGQNSLERGTYYLYASAGAAGNPEGFQDALRENHHLSVKAIDHQDCGFYKKNGNDTPAIHHHNLEVLGQAIHEQNPNIDYQYYLLPVNDNRHTCKAVAIMLGEPEIVKLARDKLDTMGLTDDHDEIARPYGLRTDDETIWNDLEISLNLHRPTRILLFEKDEGNAQKLMAKIKDVAQHVQVEPIILSTTT